MATGIIVKKVACHPEYSTISAPTDNPIAAPAANIELMIPWPIEIFSRGNWSLISPNAMGNIPIPIP
jgi:hypothetical protein